MSSADGVPEAIQWHEGMLLAPHHFQQLSLRLEELLHYHIRMQSPFHWGVLHLKNDHVTLVNGMFRVVELEAIMPDGLIVSRTAQTAEPLEVDLAPFAEEMKHRPFTVNLVVPAKKLGEPPVKGDLSRYISVDGAPTVDENTGEGEMRIPRLRPSLSLLVGDSIPKKYVGIPLARVELKDETFNTTDYLAPMISVPLQSPLGDMCSDVAKRLRQKAVFLSEKAKSPALASEAAALIEIKEMIKTIVLGLPYLEACLNTGVSHPFQLYLGLSLVAGELSAMSPSMVPPLVSPYNHNEIRASFDQLSEFVVRMLDQIHEAYNTVSFTFENGRFCLPYLEVWKRAKLTIGVRTNVGQSEADIALWFEQSLIASAGKVPSLSTRRILGAPRQRIERDAELGLVASTGLLLYSVTVDPQLIEIGEVLQVFNPDAGEGRRPADVILYVKP